LPQNVIHFAAKRNPFCRKRGCGGQSFPHKYYKKQGASIAITRTL